MRIAVEIDPPTNNADGGAAKYLLEGAARLKAIGIDYITIADNPCAVSKGDSASLATFLFAKLGIAVIPHLSCRDRNILSLRSALLSLDIAGINDILVVTGDPIAKGSEADSPRSGFNSTALAAQIALWNENDFSCPFTMSAALNVNAVNFDAELRKARRKIDSGVSRFLTQPVLCGKALDNLARARDNLDAELWGGILPIVSERNANFLAQGAIKGICVSREIAERYQGTTKVEATALAIEISLDIAGRIARHCDGFYLITPFTRVDLVEKIALSIKKQSDAHEGFSSTRREADRSHTPFVAALA